MLENIMLGFLMYGEMSGYDLKQRMLKSTSNFFDASFGTIYTALKRMEVKGAICSREVVDGGKYKKLYSITEYGKSDFTNWLEQPVDFTRTKPDHLIKVFFFGFLPKEKAISNLKAFIEEVEEVHNSLKILENQIKETSDVYQFSTLIFGINYYKYVIDWSHNLLGDLENIKKGV
ncbi:PadR family transcriptional regulator [Paenibacillus durus]|uniref:PadR family transcriptional regulator n=1 Tax=Paenibacillus durus TaxID=44251 RepID=A0A089IVL1_PAEDU|nr:PadR family transcriptional regulator [Paenibacillus durus]AIQ13004.1 PadR family transcriptional regulator [Paenibacillus durus]